MLNSDTNELVALYKEIHISINTRLGEFALLGQKGGDRELWREMCFCLCTPQNDAKKANAAVLALDKAGLLAGGQVEQIAAGLRSGGVRFHNNKAASIKKNMVVFYPGTKKIIKDMLAKNNIVDVRNNLASSVHGWGLKEASHFLRNIGYGKELCILDRHIMRCLTRYDVIEKIPDTLSKSIYLNTEAAMLGFAKKIHIPPDALDLVFWFTAKGEIFK